MTETLINFGGTVRALAPGESRLFEAVPEGHAVIGGPAVVHDDPGGTASDLDGMFFTAQTYLGASEGNGADLTFNHTIPIASEEMTEASVAFARALAEHPFRYAIRTLRGDAQTYFEALLDVSDEYEAFVLEMAQAGKLGASSGSAEHLVRVTNRDGQPTTFARALQDGFGRIDRWPIAEVAVTPIPAEPRTRSIMPLRSWRAAPIAMAESTSGGESLAVHVHIHTTEPEDQTGNAMNETQITRLFEAYDEADEAGQVALRQAILSAVPEEERADLPEALTVRFAALTAPAHGDGDDALEAIRAQNELLREQISLREKLAKPATAGRAAPPADAPAIHLDGESRRYDGADLTELALTARVLTDAGAKGFGRRPSGALMKNIADRLLGEEGQSKPHLAEAAAHVRTWAQRSRLTPGAWRANEIHQSTLANAADEWIGVAYSGQLWDDVRAMSFVVNALSPQAWPWPGSESGVIPLLDGDVTVYKVAQAADLSANPGGIPTNVVTSSTLNSGNVTATLAKFGGRSLYTGELSEDAVLPFAATLRGNLVLAFAETMEHAVIDGDSDATTSTNINDVAGTPGGTEAFLNFDGFRKLALVTNTANSSDVGTLTANSIKDVIALMGVGGQYVFERPQGSAIIFDVNTYLKALELPEVKTSDVSGVGTVINGQLTMLWNVPVFRSYFMHWKQPSRKTEATGKIDLDTAGDNTKGAFLVVRWDKWRFYWRRMLTIETTRVPAADSTEIVGLARASLSRRDTDASAIGYNVTV